MRERFVRAVLRTASAMLAERAAAEAFAAGATGLEECADGSLVVYAPSTAQGALEQAFAPLRAEGLTWEPFASVDDVDWSQAWRQGLEAVEISPRLLIRPSFASARARPGQVEVVIEPGQAFGTGGHASTRLALELLAELPPQRLAGARILDVGTGTGVLALSALGLGAREAVALDLDLLAARAARDHARSSGLAGRMRVVAGPLHALRPAPFDGILANLLRSELLPLLPDLVLSLVPGGFAILSGLLEQEGTGVEAKLSALGLSVEARRSRADPAGDSWLGVLARGEGSGVAKVRGGPAQSSADAAAHGLAPVGEKRRK